MMKEHASKQATLLVTGGCGFIGSNFVLHMLKTYPQYRIINLDQLTYAAVPGFEHETAPYSQYCLVRGSIQNRELVEHIFAAYDVRGVIHFAAESHVDNSIASPGVFVETNVMGTYTLLHAAFHYWMHGPGKAKPGYDGCRFHHISTDEVYGSLGESGVFTEESPYAPNSPYSASKAGSDMLVRCFHHTYGLNTVITNCSNNYGPRQHDEKLIPTVIRSALSLKPIPVYGNGMNVRDWLHVQDHVEAIDLVYHEGRSGETYNIGANNEWSNLQLVREICAILDELAPERLTAQGMSSYEQFIRFVGDRPGHDFRYAIDAGKLRSELGWSAKIDFRQGLRQTVEWYMQKYLQAEG